MVRVVLELVVFYLLLTAVRRFIGGVAQGMAGSHSHRPPPGTQPPAVTLARDPVCGTYVDPARAVSVSTGGTTRYFCSEKCRRTWMRG